MAQKEKTKKRKLSQRTKDRIAALPPKKRKYAAGLLRGKSKRQAALDAGYSKSTAGRAKEKIETVDVTKALQSAFYDLDPNIIGKLAKRLVEGLDAEKTEFAKYQGTIGDSVNVVDFEQRRKYAGDIARAMGVKTLGGNTEDEDGENVKVTVLIDC